LNYDTVLSVMNYLEKETDYIPWASTNRAYTYLNRWITGSRVYPRFQAFMRKNVEAFYNRLGSVSISGEQRVDVYGRNIAINIACHNQLEACLTQTTGVIENMLATGNALSVNHYTAIYCNGMRNVSGATFSAMQNKMLASNVQNDRYYIIAGMGCTQNFDQLTNFLNFAVDSASPLTTTERSRIITSPVNMGEASIRIMIQFLGSSYEGINNYGLVSTLCSNIASRICNQELFDDFVETMEFLLSIGVMSANQVNTYRNSAYAILDWQNDNLEHVESFFDALDLSGKLF